jgi:hypothetical protein
MSSYYDHIQPNAKVGQIGLQVEKTLDENFARFTLTQDGFRTRQLADLVTLASTQASITDVVRGRTAQGDTTRFGAIEDVAATFMKAPTANHLYVSIPLNDFWEFDAASFDGQVHAKLGDPFGVGGWTAQEIVDSICTALGVSLVWNIPDWSVPSFDIRKTETYIGAINALVGFLRPTVYFSKATDTLYVLSASTASSWQGYATLLPHVETITQHVRRKWPVQSARLDGGNGVFDVAHYVGTCAPGFGSAPFWIGDRCFTYYYYGSGLWTGTLEGHTDETFVRKETTYRRDLFLNLAEVIYERVTTYTWQGVVDYDRLDVQGNPVRKGYWVLTSVVERFTEFDLQSHLFETPRPVTRYEATRKQCWFQNPLTSEWFWALTPLLLKEQWEHFTYDDMNGGIQTYSLESTFGLVYEQTLNDETAEEHYRRFGLIEKKDRDDGADLRQLNALGWGLVRVKEVLYGQANSGVVRKQSYERTLKESRASEGLDPYTATVECGDVAVGEAPRAPIRWRGMQVYWESADLGGTGPQAQYSHGTVCSWSDAKRLLDYILEHVEQQHEIFTTVRFYGDVPIDVGWPVQSEAVYSAYGHANQHDADYTLLGDRAQIIQFSKERGSSGEVVCTATIRGFITDADELPGVEDTDPAQTSALNGYMLGGA